MVDEDDPALLDGCVPALDPPDAPESPVALEEVLAPSDDDFFPWSRKSVTYQPLPFSAKPAAVTCLTIFG